MIQEREMCNIIETYPNPFKVKVFVRLDFSGFRFKVMRIYSTPASKKIDFEELSDSFLEQISTERVPTIICGDINIDVLSNNLLKSRYLNVIECNGFKILSNVLTRIISIKNVYRSRTCDNAKHSMQCDCSRTTELFWSWSIFGNQYWERKALKCDVLQRIFLFERHSGLWALFCICWRTDKPKPKVLLKTLMT